MTTATTTIIKIDSHPTLIVYYGLLMALLTVVVVVQGQNTITFFETRYVTEMTTMSTDVTCAKVVNVTGICRRRRGFKLDTPLVLMFDETMDIDLLEQPLFAPTQTIR